MPTKIKLRQRKIKNGRESLYFDIYPPIFNPLTGIESRREFLNLYIYSNPQNKEQAEHNTATLQMANEVLQEKQELLKQGKYEFTPEQQKQELNDWKQAGAFDITDCYTINEVLEKYSISETALQNLIKRESIPKIKKGWYAYVPKPIIDKLLK